VLIILLIASESYQRMQYRFTCFYAKADERLDAWPPPAPNMVHGCFFTLRPLRCSSFLFGQVCVFIHQCRAIESGTCRADGRRGLHVATGSPNIISAGPLIGQSQQFLASDMGIPCLLKERREGFVRTCLELRIHTFCLFARNIPRLEGSVDTFAVRYSACSARPEPVINRQVVWHSQQKAWQVPIVIVNVFVTDGQNQ